VQKRETRSVPTRKREGVKDLKCARENGGDRTRRIGKRETGTKQGRGDIGGFEGSGKRGWDLRKRVHVYMHM